MAGFVAPLVANVTEAGDITLLGLVLVLVLAVGLALFALDTVVGRLHRRPDPGSTPPGP